MGKSSLLQLFIKGLIDSGHGVGVLDPHEDLAEWVLDSVPRDRVDDTVYLNLADTEFPGLSISYPIRYPSTIGQEWRRRSCPPSVTFGPRVGGHALNTSCTIPFESSSTARTSAWLRCPGSSPTPAFANGRSASARPVHSGIWEVRV